MKLPNLKFLLNRKMEETNVEYVTKEEAQAMIDAAITQHNRNASIISMCLGIIFLSLFAEGFFRVMGMIPPFMGIDVSVVQTIIDNIKQELVNSLS
tara:strand:- start:178 stop:465 length:288 start_codon:yes stop_codon:yes gene_type:complete